MTKLVSLSALYEDKRIEVIAATARQGKIVGAIVDGEEEKVLRYIAKLEAAGVRVIERQPGPFAGSVLLRVGPLVS